MLYTNELTHLSKEDRRTVELAQQRDPKLREDVFPILESLSTELAEAKELAERRDEEIKTLEHRIEVEEADATRFSEERDAAERTVAKLRGHLDDLKAAVQAYLVNGGDEELSTLLAVDHHKL